MDVGIVRVLVHHHLVRVRMGVGLLTVPLEIVRMLVMLVMTMRMGMLERLVPVLMDMPLLDVQPYAKRHQCRRRPEQRTR